MENEGFTVYGYRWVVLLFFSLMQGVMQMLWITFAPITSDAVKFYGVSAMQIGFLAMSFMVVYLFVSIPASWIIDNYGIRKGVGFGVALTGIFGFTRGVFGESYQWVLVSTIGIAVAQPFILNAITAMAARWFPLRERATAGGIAVLAQFMGIIVAMATVPLLSSKYGIPGMLNIFGISSLVLSILYLIFVKDRPPTPPAKEDNERVLVFDGLRHIFHQRDMILLLLLLFIGLGMFNAVTTWIEQILAPRGFGSVQAGNVGAIMMVGGILGAIIMPVLSDRLKKRKILLVICIAGSLPGLIGLTFATGYTMLLVSSFVLGFFFMSSAPIAYQYSAEISYPAPEATSQGLLMLSGQISGIIFIYGLDMFRTETSSMMPFMVVLIVLVSLSIFLTVAMNESPVFRDTGIKD
ncbi:MAG: MFS transporter [Thermodesulfobacteriota bacterium]|nr:MFS transporter [Thermodesulfobacteriota bacterium]